MLNSSTQLLSKLNEDEITALAIFERQIFDWPWTLDTWYSMANSSRQIFVGQLKEGDRIVGSSVYELTSPDFCHLYKIVVDPSQRRKGYGYNLFKDMTQQAADTLGSIYDIYLEVEETNRGAIALYTALGLKETFRKPKFYQNGRTAVIMQCDSKSITYDKP